ncbi:MAG: PD-(D/E)XK nuclease family protein [Bacteroidota bacterium]|nr:PD-(D/E)XK nuclease family protein [Bacteroidota bacterium]
MSAVRSLLPSENFIESLAAMLHPSGSDYSRSIVVFPGKRPSHFLRKSLAERAKHSIIPPRIFSIDNFIDFLFREKLSRRERLAEPLDAVALLYEVHSRTENKLGGKYFLSLDRFLPLGMKILAELEELKIADVPVSIVREKVGGISFGHVRSLALLYEQLYSGMERRGFVTRALQYSIVAHECETLDLQDYKEIILGGFFALTTSEQILFRELLRRDNVVLFYQEGRGIEKHLRAIGIEAEEKPSAQNAKADVSFYKSPDAHGQVFALSGLIHELERQGTLFDEKTAIVLPTADALFPVANHVLPLLEQYNISHLYPVARTPMYGFLNSLMNVIETTEDGKYYAPSYIKFILHPYTKNIRLGKRADATRVLFHSIENYFIGRKSRMFFSLDELEHEPRIYAAVSKIDDSFTREVMEAHLRSIHDVVLRSFTHFSSLEDCAAKSMGVLEYISNNSTANLHPLFKPFALQCIESLDKLRASLLHDRSFDETPSYFVFLRHYLSTVEVPFTGTPLRGVQVLGQLETRNLKFDRVFVLDVNDDVIPRSKHQDMLLPQQVRRALHVPGYHESEETSSYYFDTLLSGAKEVHLFFVENGQKERSRLIEKLLWEIQKEKKSTNDEELVRTIHYDVSLSNDVPKPIEKANEIVALLKDFSFSATTLDTYLQCGLKFYYRYVLRLYEKEIVSGDIEQSDVGSVVHKVLAEFFRQWRGTVLTENKIRWENLEPVVDRCFAEQFGSDVAGAVYLLRGQVKKHMRQFLEEYQLPLLQREQIELIDVERKLEVEKSGVRFRGVLDRIERRDDRAIILDYKTGSRKSSLKIRFDKLDPANRETWESSIGSLQLPVYILMLSVQSPALFEKISASYVFLGNHLLDEECEEPLFDDEGRARELYQKIEEVIFRLVREIQDAAIPFRPARTLQDNCPSCPFTSICGTSWVRRWTVE